MRIEKHKIKNNETINEMSITANNLYNHANFILRQNFFNNKTDKGYRKFLNYNTIHRIIKNMNEENYIKLPRQTSQQVLRDLVNNWNNFRKAEKDYFKNPSKYRSRPKPPKYKSKGDKSIIKFTNQQCRIHKKDGLIHLPTPLQEVTIKPYKAKDIREIVCIPRSDYFEVLVCYKEENSNRTLNDNENIASIDLGLDNLITMVSNVEKPLIINGKGLKSKNKYFNRKIKYYQSLLQNNSYSSKRILKYWEKRHNVILDYFHKATKEVVKYCVKNNISKVIIGYNKQQKYKSKLKNFVQIPIFSIIPILRYKLEEQGIKLIETEESYTSKTSFIDNEKPIKHDVYKGKRVKRGLFKTEEGKLLNADVNGAFQIMKKVFPDVEIPRDNGFVYNPFLINC